FLHFLFDIRPYARPLPLFFFFTNTPTPDIYTLSLHDALPIYHPRSHPSGWCRACSRSSGSLRRPADAVAGWPRDRSPRCPRERRSEEHTSELQSLAYLVCRLLLEKKNDITSIRVGHDTNLEAA